MLHYVTAPAAAPDSRQAGLPLPPDPVKQLLIALLCVACVNSQVSRKPNVLVIIADDMGYADIGVNGSKDIPTPHIDSLALNGIRCTSGYVSAPMCSPTRSGLLTGRYQQRYGHEFNPDQEPGEGHAAEGLPASETTFPERMKAAGYVTGMIGKWHLGTGADMVPLERGFDEFFGFLGGQHAYFSPKVGSDWNALRRGDKPVAEAEYLTQAFGREASAFVARHRDRPWFLCLAFNADHPPLQASPEKLQQFEDIPDSGRRTYAAMQASMDDAIGEVMARLRLTGQEERTLIFFLSDNGGWPKVADNGILRGGKTTMWEGGIRVPILVQWKGHLPAGKTYDQPVIQLDILPTALAAAGVSVRPEWKLDGVNLLPFLNGEDTSAPHDALYWRLGRGWAVRQGGWKLVSMQGRSQPPRAAVTANNAPPRWLFNLTTDPSESTDLASKFPHKVQELATLWEEWSVTLAPPAWPGKAETLATPSDADSTSHHENEIE